MTEELTTVEDKVLELLSTLHTFNHLTEDIVKRIGAAFRLDTFELCKKNGITYDLG